MAHATIMDNGDTPSRRRWVFFVIGPTACGKTTIARYLAEQVNMVFLEGDDFHSKSNVEKMTKGQPLTDSDRWGWLEALRSQVSVQVRDLIITCSALKKEYRDFLRDAALRLPNLHVCFLYLDAPESVLRQRADARKGHYAGGDLVHSQFETLEQPEKDEAIISIDVSHDISHSEHEALRTVEQLLRGNKKISQVG